MKKKKDSFTIPKKAMYGIAPAIAICGLLIAKHQPGELLLFLIGIFAGIMIGKGWFEKE